MPEVKGRVVELTEPVVGGKRTQREDGGDGEARFRPDRNHVGQERQENREDGEDQPLREDDLPEATGGTHHVEQRFGKQSLFVRGPQFPVEPPEAVGGRPGGRPAVEPEGDDADDAEEDGQKQTPGDGQRPNFRQQAVRGHRERSGAIEEERGDDGDDHGDGGRPRARVDADERETRGHAEGEHPDTREEQKWQASGGNVGHDD